MAHRQWSPEAVVMEIQERYSKNTSLAWIYVRKDNPDLLTGAEEHFGSWKNAILAAGFNLRATHF